MQGYIKLHRKLLENPIVSNTKYFAVWVILLMLAQHKDIEFLHGNQLIKLKKGQLLTGRKQLAELSGVAEGTIETILNYLESQQQIQQQKTTKYRVLTILNWDKYQEDEQRFQQQNDNKMTHTIMSRMKKKDTKVSGSETSFGNENINSLIKGIKKVLGFELADYDRNLLSNIYKLCEKYDTKGKVKKDREWLQDNWKVNANDFFIWYKGAKVDKGFGAQTTRTIYINFKLWFNNKGKPPK